MSNLENLVDDILEECEDENGHPRIFADQFISKLEQLGYMIVPIEDPTNLRFGVDE
jgi:hypothetical protein